MPKWRANLRCGTTIGSKRKPVAEILHDGLLATVGRIEVATRICEAHNADIDALTAERDELQRRLDAVVAKISEAVVSDDDCVCSMLCHSAITAIAEGRDNG